MHSDFSNRVINATPLEPFGARLQDKACTERNNKGQDGEIARPNSVEIIPASGSDIIQERSLVQIHAPMIPSAITIRILNDRADRVISVP